MLLHEGVTAALDVASLESGKGRNIEKGAKIIGGRKGKIPESPAQETTWEECLRRNGTGRTETRGEQEELP